MALVATSVASINSGVERRLQSANALLTDTNHTLTPEQLVGFLFSMTPTTARTLSLPSAGTLVTYLSHRQASDAIEFVVRNFGDAGNTITVATASSVSGDATVSGRSSKRFLIRLTSVNPAAPTYTLEVLTDDAPVSGITDDYFFTTIDFNTDPNPFGPIPFVNSTVFFVIVPTVSNTYVVQVPTVASLTDNKKVFVIKDSGNCSGSRPIRVQATGTNTINPASGTNATGDFFDLMVAGSALTLLANPTSTTGWEVI